MKFDEFRNYIDEMLKSANNELDYCVRGLHGDKKCNDDNPNTTYEEWLDCIHYTELEIYELENAKKVLDRFEKSLEVEK